MSSEKNYLNDSYKSFFEDSLKKKDPELHKAINDKLIRKKKHILRRLVEVIINLKPCKIISRHAASDAKSMV